MTSPLSLAARTLLRRLGACDPDLAGPCAAQNWPCGCLGRVTLPPAERLRRAAALAELQRAGLVAVDGARVEVTDPAAREAQR